MNYYERHLGDYAKDTSHLSMLEHGAYTLLLDRYYSKESGIAADDVYRVAKANSKQERQAVDVVLKEFFALVDGVWAKNRVEEEIQRYRDSIPAAEEKKLNDKERQRRSRDRRKQLFEDLRQHGRVMPWDTSTTDLQNELSRIESLEGHDLVTPPVTRDNTASQSPVSSPQSPERVLTPKTKAPKPRKHTIPDDFGLTPERQSYAEKHLPNVDSTALMETFRSMSKAKGWEYVDWNQHWQTLVRQWAPNSGHWTSDKYPIKSVTRPLDADRPAYLDENGVGDLSKVVFR